MSLENVFGNFIIHLLFLFRTTSNVRFTDSAYCLIKVIVSAPLIRIYITPSDVNLNSNLNCSEETVFGVEK